MASWLKADGTIEVVQPKNGRNFQLEELKRFVASGAPNDYIEIVYPRHEGYEGQIMVINEEGKLFGLPRNQRATELFGYTPPTDEQIAQLKAQGVVMIGFEPEDRLGDAGEIVGDVLLCNSTEVD